MSTGRLQLEAGFVTGLHMSPKYLDARYDTLEQRLANLERVLSLLDRWAAVSDRLHLLEAINGQKLQHQEGGASDDHQQPHERPTSVTPDASPIQQRLELELISKQFSTFKFIRVPEDYYDRELEYRQSLLNAHTIDHLCKSIVMENTRAHASVHGWSNPNNSKWYVVIVQYTARLNTEKLKNFIHKLNCGKIGKQFFNMRLAPGEVSDDLSGFVHNAVSPVGLKTPLPIIMSDKIAALQPDFFWLGGGEVDLKLGMRASEFIQEYTPFVADITF